jgi:hypothetical protein
VRIDDRPIDEVSLIKPNVENRRKTAARNSRCDRSSERQKRPPARKHAYPSRSCPLHLEQAVKEDLRISRRRTFAIKNQSKAEFKI